MFTKDEIQEIQRKLELSGKKLSQLPLVTEILEEDLLPILQKKENKSTTAGSYSLFVQNQILPKIENLIEASTGEIKSSLLEVYKNLLLNSEDNKNEIIEAINDLKAIVNKEIQASLPVVTEIMNLEDAKKTGAMALFGEKYGETVRVVEMGDFSKELCGGTHVSNTGEITLFKIISEAGVAAGVRRIEALTGEHVMNYYAEIENEQKAIAAALKTNPADILDKIAHLQAELKALQSENESLKSKMAQSSLGDVMDQVKEIKGVKVLAAALKDVDMNGLRDLGDQLKEKLGEGVVVLASDNAGKVNLMATATDGAMKAGAHAGNLIKAIASIVGGGGGGRPNMAQAGGKNPEKISDAIAAVYDVVEGQLK